MLLGTRLASALTALPPCCLRIHPHDNSLLLVGTYKLDSGRRHGSVDLYRYSAANTPALLLEHSIATESAVLDLKFHPADASVFVAAHSTGILSVWHLDERQHPRRVRDLGVTPDRSLLVTSVFFSPLDPNCLLATLSSGALALLDFESGTVLRHLSSHDLECWLGEFGVHGELLHVVFTAGDDAKLIAHDTRVPDLIWSTSHRHHDAGVVAVLPLTRSWNTANPHHLWTGSYDDHLRVLDLRILDPANPQLVPGRTPRVLHSHNLGGGVWRLIPNPSEDKRLLVCCMYDGARIAQPDPLDGASVTHYYKGDHQSMCYGGDWATKDNFVATCSFYDNVVQVWSPDSTA